MTPRIEHRGKLIHECTLPGHTRADGLYPGHINAAQLSAQPVPPDLHHPRLARHRRQLQRHLPAPRTRLRRAAAGGGRARTVGRRLGRARRRKAARQGSLPPGGVRRAGRSGSHAGRRPLRRHVGASRALRRSRHGIHAEQRSRHAPAHERRRVGPVSIARRRRRHRADRTAGRPAPAGLRRRLPAVLDRRAVDAPDLHATGPLYGVGRRVGGRSTPSTAAASARSASGSTRPRGGTHGSRAGR